MKQQHFEEKYTANWHKIETIIDQPDAENSADFAHLFRQLCHQLAIAKHRRYSPQLVSRLNELVIKAHHHFYAYSRFSKHSWLHFLLWGFPNAVRANKKFVYIALALFLIPLMGMGLACGLNEEFVYSFSSPEQVSQYESMYDPGKDKLGRERDSQTDVLMFGFYIKNNIGVSFRTFASGVFFGLGSIYFLVFNGLAIGSVAGHLTQLGYTQTFYSFVIGHGAFELTAIIFSGAAGLKLGYALINPGQFSRLLALRMAGKDAVLIIYGSTLMLIIAAFIEAFWSSSSAISYSIKYSVGGLLWLLVCIYFFKSRKYP